jgi:hypothetical protein
MTEMIVENELTLFEPPFEEVENQSPTLFDRISASDSRGVGAY